MAKKTSDEQEEKKEEMYRFTALRPYPGNGVIGIPAMRKGNTIDLPRYKAEQLRADMPHGWEIKKL